VRTGEEKCVPSDLATLKFVRIPNCRIAVNMGDASCKYGTPIEQAVRSEIEFRVTNENHSSFLAFQNIVEWQSLNGQFVW
jgi:hypothetical protein